MRAFHKLVAKDVISIGVGVDQNVDVSRRWDCIRNRGQNVTGQKEAEKRVNEQALIAVDNEAGIAPAPGTVRLKISVGSRPDLLQPLLESPVRHKTLLLIRC